MGRRSSDLGLYIQGKTILCIASAASYFHRKMTTSLVVRPSRKLRCCDRTNSRKFSDSPRIHCGVSHLTDHRNFPANLTTHCQLPQLSPSPGYQGRKFCPADTVQTLAEF